MTRRLVSSVAVLAATAAAVAGCGSSDSGGGSTSSATSTPAPAPAAAATTSTTAPAAGSSTAAGGDLQIKAVEANGLSFDKKTLDAKSGKVTITMANPGGDSQPHGVAIEGNGVDKDGKVVQPGGTSTVSLDLKPGKYTFYCPVPGHRQAGMEGTLTVQ